MEEVHIFFDCDSTLSRIEGIDELARTRGVYDQVASLTHATMEGTLTFEDSFARRLELIRPDREEMKQLGRRYLEHVCDGADRAIETCKRLGYSVYIVSGGFREPILSLAAHLGIRSDRVFANDVYFGDDGRYQGYDKSAATCRENGKAEIVQSVRGRKIMIGDGNSDLQTKPFVDVFVAFTGVVRRAAVVSAADFELNSFVNFDDFIKTILGFKRKESNYAIS